MDPIILCLCSNGGLVILQALVPGCKIVDCASAEMLYDEALKLTLSGSNPCIFLAGDGVRIPVVLEVANKCSIPQEPVDTSKYGSILKDQNVRWLNNSPVEREMSRPSIRGVICLNPEDENETGDETQSSGGFFRCGCLFAGMSQSLMALPTRKTRITAPMVVVLSGAEESRGGAYALLNDSVHSDKSVMIASTKYGSNLGGSKLGHWMRLRSL